MRACPTPQSLESFIRDDDAPGTLSADALSEHIEQCGRCAEIVEQLCAAANMAQPPTTVRAPIDTVGPQDWQFLRALSDQFPTLSPSPADTAHIPFPQPGSSDQYLGALENYQVIRRIDGGGFGEVYEAYDQLLTRPVALKLLRVTDCDNQALVRFQREARAAGSIRHENVVVLHQVIEPTGDFPYACLVMEYVRGGSLRQRLETDGGYDVRQIVQWMIQAAHGLAAVHAGGLLHRDLKPANLLVDEAGVVKLGDFGLARPLVADTQQSVNIVGTPPYMSPEQILKPDQLTCQSDIYGLGIVFYQLLTGVRPFQGRGEGLRKQIIENPPPAIRALNPQVPLDIETICLRCLHKEPARRFASAQDLANDLRNWLDGKPIVSRPIGRFERARWWTRRHPTLATLIAGALFVAIATSLAAWTMHDLRQKERAARQQADANARLAKDLQADTFETLTLLVNKLSNQFVDHDKTATIFEHITARLDEMIQETSPSGDIATTARAHLRLAMAYDTLGPFGRSDQTLLKARDHFLKAIELLEPLRQTETWLLITACDGLAANCNKRGEIDQAELYFQQIIGDCDRLLALQNDDPQALRAKSVGLESLADIARQRGQDQQRLVHLQACLAIRQQLAQSNSGTAQSKYDLASVLILLGDTLRQDNTGQAADYARQAMLLSEEIVGQDPQNISFLRSLANGYDRQTLSCPELERISWSKKALEVREKIVRLAPLERTSVNDLLASYLGMFDRLSDLTQADTSELKKILDLANEQAERWYASDSTDPKAIMFLSRVHLGYNQWYLEGEQPDEALVHARRAVELRRQSLQQASTAANRRYLVVGLNSLVENYLELQQYAEALAASKEQLAILEQMAESGQLSPALQSWSDEVRQRIANMPMPLPADGR